MSQIQVTQLDNMLLSLQKLEDEKEELADKLKAKNKEISTAEARLSEVLDSLEREEYDSPHGKVMFVEDFAIKQPEDDKKHLLWDWMKQRGIFERYAQVHATSLKSLFRAERAAAVEAGEDPMTFTLPGMEPATTSRRIKFKSYKKKETPNV